MSETIVVAEDPIINFNQGSIFAVPQGALFTNYQTFLSQSQSATQIQIDTPPPNPYVVIDPVIYACIPVTIYLNGVDTFTDTTQNLINYGFDTAFRCLPFQSNLSNLNVQLNNTTLNQTQYDLYPDLFRLGISEMEQYKMFGDLFPSYLDKAQTYKEGLNRLWNPLGGNSYAVKGNYPRGLFPAFITQSRYVPANPSATPPTAAVPAQAIFQTIIIEPMLIHPFLWGDQKGPGFVQINKLTWTFNFVNNWIRMLCFAHNRVNVNNCQLFIGLQGNPAKPLAVPTLFKNYPSTSKAAMLMRFLTLPMGNPAPESMTYPLTRFNTYSYNMGPAQPLVQQTGVFNNTNFKYMPDGFLIYLRQRNQDRLPTSTDTYARIDNINIQWNNQTGILANASPMQLYRISADNGIDMSWSEWYGMQGNLNASLYTPPSQANNNTESFAINDHLGYYSGIGSMLYLKCGTDIPLMPGEIITQDGNWNLQFTIQYTNIGPATINYDLYVVSVNSGMIVIHNNQANQFLGVLRAEDALRLDSAPRIPVKDYENIKGGSILSTIGAIARVGAKAAPYVGKALGWVGDALGSGMQFTGGRKRKRLGM